MNLLKLKDPFPYEDVEWRIQQSGLSKDGVPWASVLAYVSARAIQNRLDDVCSPENWRTEKPKHIKEDEKLVGVDYGLSIRVPCGSGSDEENVLSFHRWVTKWDGADNTEIEPFKGGISGGLKRAAVLWGIGRYLYDLETGWAEFVNSDLARKFGAKKVKIQEKWYFWVPPKLPEWALPKVEKK